MSDDLPAPEPPVNPETEAFWAATADGQLMLGHCDDCGHTFYYPRSRCPDCLSDATTLVEASGRGTVYTYSVVRQSEGAYVDAVPYVLAYVELEEGPRMMTNVVGAPVDAVAVGQVVEVTFDETDGPYRLPRFTPI